MGELRAPKRVSSGVRRSVQGRLSIAVEEEVDTGVAVQAESGGRVDGFRRPVKPSSAAKRASRARQPVPVFHPLAYRSVVAGWSLENRERWGRRTNELEDTGLTWRDAEAQAFVEVWHRVRLSDVPRETTPVASEDVDEV
jgi:hypothetical protein